MNNTKKTIRIIIDAAMLIFLILTLATMRASLLLHTIFGGVFVFFMAAHICLTLKWMIGIGKKLNKVKPKIRRHFIVNITLTTAWLVCIVTGILAGIHTLTGPDALFVVRRIHGITGAIACVLTAVHLFQHRKRLAGLLRPAKSNLGE